MEENQKVTPLQERILALMLEGISDEDVWGALGIGQDLLDTHKETLRRTLDVADDQELQEYIRTRMDEPGSQVVSTVSLAPNDERRIRILLRLTLTELLEVASNAELRAHMLQQTVEAVGTADPASAQQESEDLLTVAKELKAAMDRLLSEIRGRS